jgi:asparagine synthase (glutamine-hydrolysing)
MDYFYLQVNLKVFINILIKNININALTLFFRFGYIIQPYSIFQNMWKLKSGHYGILDLKNGNFKEVKYWDVIDFYNRKSF